MAELLSYAETKKLMDELEEDQRKLVEDLVPNQISVGGIQRVLQNLMSERISIRDLPTILEGIADACGHTRNLTMITEHVRMRLSRQICEANTGPQGHLPIVQLSPEWEQAFAEAVAGEGDERQLAMAPSKLQEFILALNQTLEHQAMLGESPVLLTSPLIRPYVRSIVERVRPVTTIMSQNEVHPKARIKTLDTF
jgi:flagellar biosynthesis protein FlhA